MTKLSVNAEWLKTLLAWQVDQTDVGLGRSDFIRAANMGVDVAGLAEWLLGLDANYNKYKRMEARAKLRYLDIDAINLPEKDAINKLNIARANALADAMGME